jgi:signal transduction histidine kinase
LYKGISRKHAQITPGPNNVFFLADLGSHNGSLVNGVRVQNAELRVGDILQLGPMRYELRRAPGSSARSDLDTGHSTLDLSQYGPLSPVMSMPPSARGTQEGGLLVLVANLFNESQSEAEYLERILSLVQATIDAQSGSLYVYPTNRPVLSPLDYRLQVGEDQESNFPKEIEDAVAKRGGLICSASVGQVLVQTVWEGNSLGLVLYLRKDPGRGQFLEEDLALLGALFQFAFLGLASFSSGKRLLALCEQIANERRLTAIGELATSLMHEIRTPLGFMNMNLEQLKHYTEDLQRILDGQNDPNTRRILQEFNECLRDVLSGTQHINDLTDGVLGVARREDIPNLQNLAGGIERVSQMLNADFKRRARLVCRIDPATPLVRIAQGQVVQVLINLLTNALQALPEARSVDQNEILISLHEENGGALLSISDNGTGIPTEVAERVFERYFTTKPSPQGTGLGLWISKQIIEDHGGRISLRSEVGRGTTVMCWFPSGTPDATTQEEPQ